MQAFGSKHSLDPGCDIRLVFPINGLLLYFHRPLGK